MEATQHWQQRIGRQRDWVWRGWQTRYTYMRPQSSAGISSGGCSRQAHTQPSAPPLILLHGFGASIEQWRNNLPVLSRDRAVYALDLLGFGGSRKAPADYKVELWVEQVYDFWQTFIRQPVVLVGNSIGSLACMAAAAVHPEMVKGIVMLSLPDASVQREQFPRWVLSVEAAVKGLLISQPLGHSVFKIVSKPDFVRRWAGFAYANQAAVTDELVEILAAPARDEGAARTFCSLFKAISKPEFAPVAKAVLPTLKIPILLIWGRQDRMVPPSLAETFTKLNSQIQLIELDGVGHCPHDECPDKFNQILLDWLHGIESQAADTSVISGSRSSRAK